MAAPKRMKPPVVHIVLDTNSLFTDHADKLLSLEISNFIKTGTQDTGNDVLWHIPSTVRQERHVQMLERASALLPNLGKIELLLGHKLNIDESTLAPRVIEAINRQITEHKLKEISFDPTGIDWVTLVENAVYRRPPFSGTKEKGFKDAIVLEIFCQFAASLPKSPASCRIILLTGDGPLREAAIARMAASTNFKAIPNLDDLRNYINAIASHLPDEEVTRILDIARPLFFTLNDENTLWYKNKLGYAIDEVTNKQELPNAGPGFKIDKTSRLIGPTNFVRKEGRKIVLSTPLTVKIFASRPVRSLGMLGSGLGLKSSLGAPLSELGKSSLDDSKRSFSDLAAALANLQQANSPTQRVVKTGDHELQIDWEAALTQRGTLTSPKLIEIRYVASNWSDEQADGGEQQAS